MLLVGMAWVGVQVMCHCQVHDKYGGGDFKYGMAKLGCVDPTH